ncbi:MAG: hypothetical protein Q8Q95_01345 [bacterium]|nr:hypothetical protein [bacterium]
MAGLLKFIIFIAVLGSIALFVGQVYFGEFLNPQGGFFISVDRGTTWKKIGALATGGSINRLNILEIKSNPKDSRILYAATLGAGVLKSVDGGEVWYKLGDKNNILAPRASVFALAADPRFPNYNKDIPDKFYLAVYQNKSGKVLKTEDGGLSFKEVYLTSRANFPVFDVAVDPHNPNIVWVATGEGNLLKSQDGGETWKLQQEFGKAINYLLINPSSSSQMLVTTFSGSIFTSPDGGASWTDDTEGLRSFKNAKFIEKVLYNPADGGVYLTSKFGLIKSYDFGINWQAADIVIANDILPVTDIAFGGRSSPNIFVSASNFIYSSKDAGKFWQIRKLGTARQIRTLWVDPKNPDKIIAGTSGSGKKSNQSSLFILPK